MLSKRAIAVTALVPVVLACELLLPDDSVLHVGVGEALACSGGAGNAPRAAGWWSLAPSLPPSSELGAVPVATDGFFVIHAEAYALSVEAAQASLQVVVTNEAGETVAGETKLLLSKREGWYLFGWSASSPLEVGAKLRAELSAAPTAPSAVDTVGGAFALEVVGEPTPLPEPSFRFSAWLDYYLGLDGPMVTCNTQPGTCGGPTTIDVPSTIYERKAADVTWQLVHKVVGGVAWTVRIAPSPTNSDAEVRGIHTADYFANAAPGSDLPLGRVVFPTPAQSYCVTVVLKDLRTDQETRGETCAAAPPTQLVESDTLLDDCSASPSTSLTEAWCRLRNGPSEVAACVLRAATGGGSGGSSGSGGSYVAPISDFVAGASIWGSSGSANEAGSSSPDPGSALAESNAAAGAPRTSKGCQLGGSGLALDQLAWPTLMLALLALRRRFALATHQSR